MAPKFITHMTAGNHSLICIIEKLYCKNSLSVSGLSKHFFYRYLESAKTCPPTQKKKKRKLSAPKPSSRDGNMLKYLVRAQPSSTEAATLSSPDWDDNQTQDRAEPNEYFILILACWLVLYTLICRKHLIPSRINDFC